MVEDVRFLDHYRQGLSIMNVQNMTVRHCEFSGTAGILPEAGIDIEPYQTTQRVVNLLIENCRFEYNGWSGLAVNLFDLDATSLPVSITVRDCVFKNNGREENTYVKCEIYADDNHLSPVQGEVLFERCFIEESNYGAFYARKTASGYSLTFKDCTFQNVSKLPIQYNEPIALEVADYFNPSPTLGGIHFDNVLIQYDTDYSFFRVFSASTLAGIENITGHFTIVEPNGNSPILNGNGTQNNIEFTYTNQTSLPETIVNIDVIEQNAVECTQQAGEILFVRNSNNVSYPLGISYEIGGSADNGNDYHYLPQGIVIPSGANSKKIEILARQDDMEEDAEMAIFTITPSFLYQPGNFSTAEINLWDCEPLSAYEPNTTALELLIYPNPSDNQITLLLPSTSESQNILIFNKLGQLIVKHFNLENNERIVLNIEEIPSGIYFITYGGFVQKFIKN